MFPFYHNPFILCRHYLGLNSKTSANLGFLPAALISVAVCTLVGFLNGWIHVKVKIPSFMVTFAFNSICAGFALLSYGARPAVIEDPFVTSLTKSSFLGIPVLMIVPIIVLAAALYLQNYTAFGRHIYAIGTDESIPRSVGIKVDKVKMMVFSFAGFCFGIAGVLGAIRMGQGQASIGTGLMFPAQAAVIVGGTALSGGVGGVHNTIVGVIIMTVLENGLLLCGLDIAYKYAVNGLVILIAVALTIKHGDKVIAK